MAIPVIRPGGGDDQQRQGTGRILMEQLFDAAREKGLKIMEGEIFANNTNMLRLMDKLALRYRLTPKTRVADGDQTL